MSKTNKSKIWGRHLRKFCSGCKKRLNPFYVQQGWRLCKTCDDQLYVLENPGEKAAIDEANRQYEYMDGITITANRGLI